jgi:hypothetical protein
MSLVADVIDKCGVSLIPEDCSNDIDGNCILKVTLDCFQQMIANAASTSVLQGVQVGGGKKPFSEDFKALVPYLAAYNITSIDGKSLVPAGLVKPQGQVPDGIPFWTNIPLSSVLRPAGLTALNNELKEYVKNLVNR